ncbi:MAG: RNA polymerase sigma factor [Bacteroidales bacterium]|nr:RNA polymerase sigma factor [Bacteroidales bacterium]
MRGDRKAQFRLYSQYSKAMYNLAYRFMNNREDAEDMLQEAFTDCFKNIRSYRSESTFGQWLKRILINKCINHLKKKKTDLVYYENVPDTSDEEQSELIPDTLAIFNGIEMLPDGYRIILTLHLLEEYPHSDIASLLGISESTSKSQYSRARGRLRTILKNTQNYG